MTRKNICVLKNRIAKCAAAAVIAAGIGSVAGVSAYAQNAVTLTNSDSSLTQWAHIVQVAGLTQAGATNTVTVFAITNQGFDSVNKAYSNALTSPGASGSPNFQRMQALVKSQAVFGLHPMSDFTEKMVTLTSAAGTPITVDASNPAHITIKTKYISGTITGQPLVSSQAVIYPVDVDHVNQ